MAGILEYQIIILFQHFILSSVQVCSVHNTTFNLKTFNVITDNPKNDNPPYGSKPKIDVV